MFGLMTVRKARRVVDIAFYEGLIKGFQYAALISIIVFLLLGNSEAQFSWPTYPVHTPTQIYKVMKDNGSGVAVLATNDSIHFIGITQNAVVTSTGTVQLQPIGPSQVQVGSTPVTLGGAVTADANGNVIPFAPASDGATHCLLGYVIAGNTSAGGFVYVNVSVVCSQYGTSGGGGVTSFFGNTGAITALIDPTSIVDAAGNVVQYQTGGLSLGDFSGDGCEFNGTTSTTTCEDAAGDTITMTAGVITLSVIGANSTEIDLQNSYSEIKSGANFLRIGPNFAEYLGSTNPFTSGGFQSGGSLFGFGNGCSEGGAVGGATAGEFTINTAVTCNSTIGLAVNATNGESCNFHDVTTPTAVISQTSPVTSNIASYTASGMNSGDTVVFDCHLF